MRLYKMASEFKANQNIIKMTPYQNKKIWVTRFSRLFHKTDASKMITRLNHLDKVNEDIQNSHWPLHFSVRSIPYSDEIW
jgi:hypothetical protein